MSHLFWLFVISERRAIFSSTWAGHVRILNGIHRGLKPFAISQLRQRGRLRKIPSLDRCDATVPQSARQV